ncbi:hypothetical protein BZG02_13615 [Labilibaculum filiforme]|uniref:Uncharacterized protein n=1 Tax=Labilibaculum filiforme TaxID=1940526 RepID=A0A2N3HVA8_9BACT|nr:hypothetical protein [Labilibaculum filiforme]PKQ61973.1 hypothetical protein BZG02_13615 [Labilibaculum filiforme]
MKNILTGLLLILFNTFVYSQAKIEKDLDFDGIIDTVSIDHLQSIICCQLSSSGFKTLQTKPFDILDENALLTEARNGFYLKNNWMRSGYSLQFRYDNKFKKIRLIGMSRYEFGNASNDGSGESSVNLLTSGYVGNWNYYDEVKNQLVKLPAIKEKMHFDKIYFENLDDSIYFNYAERCADIYHRVRDLSLSKAHPTFNMLVAEANSYLDSYGQLSPFDDSHHAFNQIKLLPNDRDEILKHQEDFEFVTNDSIGNYDLIVYLQGKIKNKLNEIFDHKDFNEANLAKLNSGGDLVVVKSSDGKLYNFSLDEKTGGTYRSRISWMNFVGINATDLYKSLDFKSSEKLPAIFSVFEGDGFTGIYAITTNVGIKYVLTGYVRGCSSCHLTFVQLVHLNSNQFELDFDYSVYLREWDTGVSYDPETNTIVSDYVTDDLTTTCDCSNRLTKHKSKDSDENDEEGIEKNCHCIFEFDGSNFILVKHTEEEKEG